MKIKGRVYTLKCKQSGDIVYVGATTASLRNRLSQHIYSSKQHNYNLSKFIRNSISMPEIELIEECECNTMDELFCVEQYWIEQFRQWGYNLYNKIGNLSPNCDIDCVSDVDEKYVSVKLKSSIIKAVRKHTTMIGDSMSHFFEQAAEEKLSNRYLKELVTVRKKK